MSALRVLVVLAVAAAARGEGLDREAYDDLPWDIELKYPEQSYIELAAGAAAGAAMSEAPRLMAEPWRARARGGLVYKMLTALRNRDATPSLLSVNPKWIPSDTELAPPQAFEAPLKLAGAVMKRGEPAKPGAPKWNKKGRGASVLCFFKICSFHSSFA